MSGWYKEFGEFDGRPDEDIEKTDLEELDNIEVLDEWYAEHIKDIENPEIRAKEVDQAEKIYEKQKALEEKLEDGEITEDQYLTEYQYGIRSEKSKFARRTALESVGLTYDHLGDVSESWDTILSGDIESMDRIERLKNSIETLGPEESQELADRMLEERKISKEAHELISRQVRLNGK